MLSNLPKSKRTIAAPCFFIASSPYFTIITFNSAFYFSCPGFRLVRGGSHQSLYWWKQEKETSQVSLPCYTLDNTLGQLRRRLLGAQCINSERASWTSPLNWGSTVLSSQQTRIDSEKPPYDKRCLHSPNTTPTLSLFCSQERDQSENKPPSSDLNTPQGRWKVKCCLVDNYPGPRGFSRSGEESIW